MLTLCRKTSLVGVLSTTLFVGLASAQTNTSAIAGVVTDETGAEVPDATVTVTETATGQVRITTAIGEYVVSQLPPGKYDVKVAAQGFQTALAAGVTLDVAQRARLDFTMKVGPLSQQVEVTARAAVMDTDSASLGQTIEQRTVNDLPLNGRNYLTLGSLSPGVIPQIPASQGPASFVASTTGRSDRSILVGGQRESSTSYLLDGVELRNPRVGDTAVNPSLDAIEEFKIQRNFSNRSSEIRPASSMLSPRAAPTSGTVRSSSSCVMMPLTRRTSSRQRPSHSSAINTDSVLEPRS